MAGVKGRSGTNKGKDKIFAEQVRLVMLGDDPVRNKLRLRCLAEKMYEDAMNGEGWAACQIADRLDGKPAQESTVTIDDKRDAFDWTRDDLVAFINDARARGNGTLAPDGRGGESDSVH